MDRMTRRVGSEAHLIRSTFPDTLRAINDAKNRLCDYEDTGMTPAEIVAMREELAEMRVVVSKMENATEKQSVTGNPVTGNRPLTLPEVLALPEGARVWVEDKHFKSCAHTMRHNYTDSVEYNGDESTYEFALVDDCHKFYENPQEGDGAYMIQFRVWSLPVEPTEDELAKYEWEVRDDG